MNSFKMINKLDKKLKLRFITLCVNEAFFGPVKKGMHEASKLLNADSDFVGTEDIDIPKQIQLVKEAIRDRVDGIALSIADKTAFNGVIQEASDKRIPVVAFNIDASHGTAGHLCSICQDVYEAGRTLGKYAMGSLPVKSKVLMTIHSNGISALEDRLRGIQEIISEKKITWNLITTGIDSQKASDIVSETLKANPDIKAIICTGQADTEGAGLSVERDFPHRGLYVAGFDLSTEILRFIQKGIITFTIDQQPYLQGFLPVIHLLLYIRYGIKPSDVDTGANIINRENVGNILSMSVKGYR